MHKFALIFLLLVLLSFVSAAPSNRFQNKASNTADDKRANLSKMISRVVKRDFSDVISRVMRRENAENSETGEDWEDYDSAYESKRDSLKNMVARVMKRNYLRVMKRMQNAEEYY